MYRNSLATMDFKYTHSSTNTIKKNLTTCQIFPCGNESVMRQRWQKNTARWKHRWQNSHVLACQISV